LLVVVRFLLLAFIKILASVFFSWESAWIGPKPDDVWNRIRLVVILNHTSLFEPVFSRLLPFGFLWRLSRYASLPAADKTMNRPIAGVFFKLLVPSVISITRNRDATWSNYLGGIAPEAIVMIAPEGRMKRPNGLDKDGKPMTVRGGVAEILKMINQGYMLLAYSGGLHHMQSPGQKFPRLFRRLRMNLEVVSIPEYIKKIEQDELQQNKDPQSFKVAVIKDLEYRRDSNCPVSDDLTFRKKTDL